MKPILLLPLVIALPAFAGTPAPVAPAPEPCLMSWFAGASVGYLTELEEPMYTVHVGVTNSCWMIAGWNVAAFAEVGYTDTDWNYIDPGMDGTNEPYDDWGKIDLTYVPVTANVKFERALSGNLNAYVGAGVGMAWVHAKDSWIRIYDGDVTGDSYSDSDSDWVFTAQVFAGLSYNVTPACAIYGGARWIYLADSNLFGDTQDLDDDWLIELGARYKF